MPKMSEQLNVDLLGNIERQELVVFFGGTGKAKKTINTVVTILVTY